MKSSDVWGLSSKYEVELQARKGWLLSTLRITSSPISRSIRTTSRIVRLQRLRSCVAIWHNSSPQLHWIFRMSKLNMQLRSKRSRRMRTKSSLHLLMEKRQTFDLVIAADGLGSTTRKLLLGEDKNCIQSLGQYTAYFSLPREERDGMLWKWYTGTGSRLINTRPKNATTSCCYLSVMPQDERRMRDLTKKSIADQKAGLTALFEGAGWQTQRLLTALQDADDLYLQHIGASQASIVARWPMCSCW